MNIEKFALDFIIVAKKKRYLPESPTLNPEYNYLLLYWASLGSPSDPQCEWCEKDLTGENVIELRGWLCEDCAEYYEENYMGVDEDPHYEHKQMGITF